MDYINELLIKGMVCDRCKSMIYTQLKINGFPVNQVSLGKVSFFSPIRSQDVPEVENILSELGFEIFVNKYTKIVDDVKFVINDLLEEEDIRKHHKKVSALIAEKINLNYNSVSELFRLNEGITIERYIIKKRIEKVKELITYTDLSLTEIAYKSGFNSINHLSSQFKDLTGFNPTYFRKLRSTTEHK
jgi:AraC family transcriptional regulator